MSEYREQIDWIFQEKGSMIRLLTDWVNINSGTDNLAGLQKMLLAIEDSFKVFGEPIERISLEPGAIFDDRGTLQKRPLGNALRIAKRPDAPIQILLCGHMDTVYPADSPFQSAQFIGNSNLRGPGAADMKGGLIIMLKALEAFERCQIKSSIGWEVIINPDEEIGSIGSEPLIRKSARKKNLALVFEPSFADGSLVSQRKGSINFTIIAKGVSAHAGRDFEKGRNAIASLIKILLKIEALNSIRKGLTINLGSIQGGGPVNIVPDKALCRCNARVNSMEDGDFLIASLEELIETENKQRGSLLEFHKEGYRPPKVFDDPHRNLFEDLRLCSQELSQDLAWRESGGVCDGNILASEGVATVDTLGAIGSHLHTFDETVDLDSLVDRARLCALFLMKIASRAIEVERYTCSIKGSNDGTASISSH